MSPLASTPKKGQGLIEYAIIIVLVAIIVIAVVVFLGPMVGNVFSDANNSLSGASAVIPVSGEIETPSADPTEIPPSEPIPSGGHVKASGGVCPPNSHRFHHHWWNDTYWCIQN